MELFDIVDENGKPTGLTVERKEAHSSGIRHRTAHIWVVKYRDGDPFVLLQKRSDIKDSFPGKYDTSSAGHIHAGDEPLPSALRELQEELGIPASEEELMYAGSFRIQYEKEFNGAMFKDNEVSFVYVLMKDVDTESLELQKEEVSAAQWFRLSEVWKRVNEKDGAFCVPLGGLKLLRDFIEKKAGSIA